MYKHLRNNSKSVKKFDDVTVTLQNLVYEMTDKRERNTSEIK